MRNFFLIVGELAKKKVIFRQNLPHFAQPSSGSWIQGSHVLWTSWQVPIKHLTMPWWLPARSENFYIQDSWKNYKTVAEAALKVEKLFKKVEFLYLMIKSFKRGSDIFHLLLTLILINIFIKPCRMVNNALSSARKIHVFLQPCDETLFQTLSPFWGPLSAIFDFIGGAWLHAVQCFCWWVSVPSLLTKIHIVCKFHFDIYTVSNLSHQSWLLLYSIWSNREQITV